jgi:hypothetical protein
MIILEGPDGGGKSTLAKQLEAALDTTLWHPGGAVDDDLVREWMKQCEHKLNQGFMLDRTTHISEFVYGPIINDRDPVSFKDLMDFYRLCGDKGWKVVYCRPESVYSLNHTKAEHDTDEQIKAVEENHKRIVDIYDHIFLSSIGDTLRRQGSLFVYDYEQNGSFIQLMSFLRRKFQ